MYYLHLVKSTLDERKTLTKVSTRTTSHNHSPKQAQASDTKEQENQQTRQKASCIARGENQFATVCINQDQVVCSFIKGFAKIAEPLYDLTSGNNKDKKSGHVDLSPEAREAFDHLKAACLQAPVLAFPDFNKPFLLETDASGRGLGAVLSQKQADGWYHPITYASHVMNRLSRDITPINRNSLPLSGQLQSNSMSICHLMERIGMSL